MESLERRNSVLASIAEIPVPAWQTDPDPGIPDEQAAIATATFHVVIAGRDRNIVQQREVLAIVSGDPGQDLPPAEQPCLVGGEE